MHVADGATEMFVRYDEQRTEYVEVIKLDDVPLRQLDLMKIDVEAMEMELIKGAAQTLDRHGPVIYVEDSDANDLVGMTEPTRLMRHLRDLHGYACINLAQSGLHDVTSLLCAPQRRMVSVQHNLRAIGVLG